MIYASADVSVLSFLLPASIYVWNRKRMLKSYYHKIQAIRITKKNFQELKKLDTADGVLDEGTIEDFEGDWFIERNTNGYEVMSGSETLILIKGKQNS